MSLRKKIRRPVQAMLRGFHHAFCSRPLPEKLGLYFHSLDPSELDAFTAAMQWVQSEGYTFTSPQDLLSSPGRSVYVSFDDNHVEWHRALPLMAGMGVRAAFFVNTCVLRGECTPEEWRQYCIKIKYSGPGQPLSRAEIREMAEAGHVIGAHTHCHHALPYFSGEVVREDLRRNREILEDITGRAVTDFAFPFGMPRYFPPRFLPLVQELGFRTVSYATAGMQYAHNGPYALQRSPWNCGRGVAWNVRNLRVNGRVFVRLTGLSPVG